MKREVRVIDRIFEFVEVFWLFFRCLKLLDWSLCEIWFVFELIYFVYYDWEVGCIVIYWVVFFDSLFGIEVVG